jgi:ribosomal protein L37AE/L43A
MMNVAHWGPGDWRKNLDETAEYPAQALAFPAEHAVDLTGRVRVRLYAEGKDLVAYGFHGQRIVIPASSIGAVRAVDEYRIGRVHHGHALLVFDRKQRVLLRASGTWDVYGAVAQVCRAAGGPKPSYVANRAANSMHRYGHRRGREVHRVHEEARMRKRPRYRKPRYRKAPDYRKLRTTPWSLAVRRLAMILMGAGGVAAGVVVAAALPRSLGSVRVTIGIALAILGAAGGIWLCTAAGHVVAGGWRWAVVSRQAGRLVRPGPFFRGRERPSARSRLAMSGKLALIKWHRARSKRANLRSKWGNRRLPGS